MRKIDSEASKVAGIGSATPAPAPQAVKEQGKGSALRRALGKLRRRRGSGNDSPGAPRTAQPFSRSSTERSISIDSSSGELPQRERRKWPGLKSLFGPSNKSESGTTTHTVLPQPSPAEMQPASNPHHFPAERLARNGAGGASVCAAMLTKHEAAGPHDVQNGEDDDESDEEPATDDLHAAAAPPDAASKPGFFKRLELGLNRAREDRRTRQHQQQKQPAHLQAQQSHQPGQEPEGSRRKKTSTSNRVLSSASPDSSGGSVTGLDVLRLHGSMDSESPLSPASRIPAAKEAASAAGGSAVNSKLSSAQADGPTWPLRTGGSLGGPGAARAAAGRKPTVSVVSLVAGLGEDDDFDSEE